MNGGGGTSTITEIALPEYADPYAKIYLHRARRMTRETGALQYDYEGDTFAEWNADEQDGIQALIDRATNGSPSIQKAVTLAESILDGDLVNSNPKMQGIFNAEAALVKKEFLEDVLPSIDNEANNMGMFGSSGHCILQAKASERAKDKLNKIAFSIYFGNYEIERRRSVAQYNNAIILGHEGLRNAEALRQAGLYKREYNQAQLTDLYKLWLAANDGEIRKIDVYANALRALRGAYISRTEPYYRPSTMTQIAGLAMAGGGMMASYYGMKRNDAPPVNNDIDSERMVERTSNLTRDTGGGPDR